MTASPAASVVAPPERYTIVSDSIQDGDTFKVSDPFLPEAVGMSFLQPFAQMNKIASLLKYFCQSRIAKRKFI